MIAGAQRTLDVAHFYASNAPESRLEPTLRALEAAADRGVRVRVILDTLFYKTYPEVADRLAAHRGVALRRIDVGPTMGGVQHAKYFIADGNEVWLGSQNFDWRALKHIHELGVRIRDARVAGEFGRVFEMDWARSVSADTLHPSDPGDRPAPRGASAVPVRLVNAPGDTVDVWPSYSPRGFVPDSTRWDLDALLRRIDGAREEIVAQFLSYGLGHGADHLQERLAAQAAIRRGAGEPHVQRVDVQRLGGDCRHDLLGQDVQRRLRHRHPIELAGADRADHRRGFHQLLALGDDDPSLRGAREQVAGAAHPLQRRRDVARRLHLDDEVDGAHVDAELERGRGHQALEPAALQLVLDEEPSLP